LQVRSAFGHQGAVPSAIHALKYRGVDAVVSVLAPPVAALLPPEASCLVPITRALLRSWRYGTDQAFVLARAVSRLTGLPVRRALRTPLRHRSQLVHRTTPRFASRLVVPHGAVLLDDVVTTGATLMAAVAACAESPVVAVTISRAHQRREHPLSDIPV
jgi:predicted amidophosphoribosyltransferase